MSATFAAEAISQAHSGRGYRTSGGAIVVDAEGLASALWQDVTLKDEMEATGREIARLQKRVQELAQRREDVRQAIYNLTYGLVHDGRAR